MKWEPLEVRFWRKVNKTETCWLWTGARDSTGYGHIGYVGRSTRSVHRLVYELVVGPIPDGLEIDHLCFVRHCVNPDHLEPVTHNENIRRRYALQTACKHGHEFTPENTYTRRGRRECRACGRVRAARYNARRAAKLLASEDTP